MHGHGRGRRFTVGALLALGLAILGNGPVALSAGPRATWSDAALARPLAARPLPGAAAAKASGLPQRETTRVGVLGISSEVGFYLAQEHGYFAEQGLNADFERFEAPGAIFAPLSLGELDAASIAVTAAMFNAVNRGVEIRMASPQSRYEPGYSQLFLDVRNDLADSGAVRDFGDLRGRTAAIINLGSPSELLIERALQRGGLGLGDVNLVQLGSGDQITAFANHGIDVGLLTEPQATIAQDRGVAVKWREAASWYPGIQVSTVMYGPNYTARNPDAGQRFLIAYLRGVREYYNAIIANHGGRDGIIDVLTQYTPLRDRALYDRVSRVYIDPNLTLAEDDLRTTMQWFLDRGLVDRMTDLNNIYDPRFVQNALRVLGPYQ
jgi:NitT/TauT family transport system substrate-binding protein